jgi:hypothetical protein
VSVFQLTGDDRMQTTSALIKMIHYYETCPKELAIRQATNQSSI